MKRKWIVSSEMIAVVAVLALGMSAGAATAVQVGTTGKTYASSAVRCAADPITGTLAPVVEAGLFDPKKNAKAEILLNGVTVADVTGDSPSSDVWLASGNNTVVVALNRRTTDTYTFAVPVDMCAIPDTSGNTFSDDGTIEYAASGKSYATVTPGCALNPATGLAQPYVHLVDTGDYVLNVSVNAEALTQLSAAHPHTPVFLVAGPNVISAANGILTVDYYVRDGGNGACTLQ